MSDYEIVWDGSRDGPNRGYLNVVADLPRQPPPPVRHHWTESEPRSMIGRVVTILTTAKQTAAELQEALGLPSTSLHTALQELKRRGILRSEPLPNRSRAFVYWVEC